MTECDRDTSIGAVDALIQLTNALEQDLLDRHGPLIAGDALMTAMGYRSIEAFRQAISRGTLGVPVFAIPNRRGKYALVKDVATWLATLQYRAVQNQANKNAMSQRPGGATSAQTKIE